MLLLYGPSGTGKTQIARTLSNEGGLSFIGCRTSDIKAGWLGHSAQKVRELFARARAQAPCIVGELSQQLDGIHRSGPAVFVLAATNRPDVIDPAILSRSVEQIEIGLPDQEQRKQLIAVFLSGVSCSDEVSEIAEGLSQLTTNYSGRDLQQLVSRAILAAVKRRGSAHTFRPQWSDFESFETHLTTKEQ